ncbi:MAG: aminoacyl-histidine dipeptidase [Gammaproteobacteria bacterium]|nr:MAG: aminoacyl-histidine dipeptidase [Gammaproteobacteria bacterium]
MTVSEIAKLAPQQVWKHFAKLCEIPRPSHHEQGVIDYIISLAEQRGLSYEIDSAGNLIVRKPATPGMESRLGVVMQGHMDMVAQKLPNIDHDFTKDPIRAYIDGEWVTADGTTLGADNGIGVAIALAVLESDDIPHPAVEGLFTVNEECGMSGALGLQPGILKGDWLFNIDTEEEGELYVGCAGGRDIEIRLPAKRTATPDGMVGAEIIVGGLKGGHSGVDIHLGRANANLLTNEFLQRALELDVHVAQFDGGSLRNAIPRDATTYVAVPDKNFDALCRLAETMTAEFRQRFGDIDPNIQIQINAAARPGTVFERGFIETLITTLAKCPNGVLRMIEDLPNVVETSDNIARITSDEQEVRIEISARSSVEHRKDELCAHIQSLFESIGATVTQSNDYPGWQPDMQSPLLALARDVYQRLYGKVPETKVIHAGLECGVLGAVYPRWKMISYGPTITGAHSPDERVRIADVGKVWDFTKALLAAVPEKA